MTHSATERAAIRSELADVQERIVRFQSRREQALDAGDAVSEWYFELEVDRLKGAQQLLRQRLLP